ncbi:MAG: DUF2029 domain-containing protein, partial [Anaerolineales bacterium]|nr:DUF2029 domain-containing protein [Anaerolineales bacterium]
MSQQPSPPNIETNTSTPWWMRIHRFLTPQRLSYAWVAGGGLWLAWLVSAILGPANVDLADQVVGTDYIQFYAAGKTVLEGESARLYDFAYQSALEQSIAGPELLDFHAFITPPFLAWLFAPLSMLPYLWSFALWTVISLAALGLSLHWLKPGRSWRAFLWSLTWFPVFAAITFGQNSLLSLAILSLVFALWRRSRPLIAGLILSLILYKPQLALGVLLLWLLEWRIEWKSLLGFTFGASILAGLSFGLLPEASQAYLEFTRQVLPQMINQDLFPLWHAHALRGFWLLLLPGQLLLAEILAILFSVLGIFAFLWFWLRKRGDGPLLFAAAICLTIWITPHAMIYDWA